MIFIIYLIYLHVKIITLQLVKNNNCIIITQKRLFYNKITNELGIRAKDLFESG